jgi:hypothetical protein
MVCHVQPDNAAITRTIALRCRFSRLSDGSDLLSIHQFEMVPELAGNPFLPQLFSLWDSDKDDKLTQEEFNAAIDTFLRAQTPEERIQCARTASPERTSSSQAQTTTAACNPAQM